MRLPASSDEELEPLNCESVLLTQGAPRSPGWPEFAAGRPEFAASGPASHPAEASSEREMQAQKSFRGMGILEESLIVEEQKSP
jgi:hypothetical protein